MAITNKLNWGVLILVGVAMLVLLFINNTERFEMEIGVKKECPPKEFDEKTQLEEQCSPFYLFKNTAHVLLPPNIPVDPQTEYKIGGRYCDKIGIEPLTYQKGKYIFPIPELLYDGIYQSKGCIDDKKKFAIRKWLMTKRSQCQPSEGVYTTDHYFHLPEKDLPTVIENIVDEGIFYNNLDKLGSCTQNQLCEGEDIVPLAPDASAFCRRVHHPMLLKRGSGLARRKVL